MKKTNDDIGLKNFPEKEVQEHIWKNRKKLSEILEIPLIPNVLVNVTNSFSTTELIYSIYIERLKRSASSLESLELIACEVPLEKKGQSTIRADFLGTSPEGPSFTIIELKKSKKTEREVFTQLLGYSGHLMSCFPGLAREDILSVLICPMENRIVKEAALYSMVIENKPVCVLQPSFENENDLNSLKLKLWIPSIEEIVTYSGAIFQESNFRTVAVSWEYGEEWNADSFVDDEFKKQRITNLNNIASYANQLLEASGLIGFAQCFQVQDGASKNYPQPNCLVLTAINPIYSSFTMKQILEKEDKLSKKMSNFDGVDLSFFITGLKNCKKVDFASGHHSEVSSYFDEHLGEVCMKTLNVFLKNFSGQHIGREYHSGVTLENHSTVFPPSTWDYFNVYCSGLLREMLAKYVDRIYEVHVSNSEALFLTGEIPFYSPMETMLSKSFLKDFLDLIRRK